MNPDAAAGAAEANPPGGYWYGAAADWAPEY